ncbi:MAG TPA: protein-disulfide reductase DsbD family protein [Fimbriimonadaceae bacterium]|nr:protein-disulfide reductase DsbD family protein [Fimbriimonadaceae bacterium]
MTTVLAALGTLAMSVQEGPRCDLALIPREAAIRPGGTFQVALRFKIESGWHIYWQNPGDSGVATNVDWKVPAGFKTLKTDWSRPHRFEVGGVVSYGFEDTAYIIGTFRAPSKISSKSVRFHVDSDWLICKESCIMGKGGAGMEIPVDSEAAATAKNPNQWRDIIGSLPASSPLPLSAKTTPGYYEIAIKAPNSGLKSPTEAYFYAVRTDVADHAKPQVLTRAAEGWVLRIPRSSYEKAPAKVLEGVLELGLGEAQNSAYNIRIPITNATTTRRQS